MSRPDGLVLVHADGGECDGTPLVGFRCPKCGIAPDMQSTEFREPPPQPERYPVEQDEYGVWWLRGRIHEVWIQKRPGYCDRGHYIAHVEPAPGVGIEFTIDEADHWPRYYMRWETMLSEIRDWLDWREGEGPKKAGEVAFGG